MSAVHQILSKKGKPLYVTNPESSVYQALQLLAEHNIGALIVKEGDKFVGIFTERDYARKVVLQDRYSRETTLKDIVAANCETVTPNTSIADCMAVMSAKSIRYLPVLENAQVVGIISIGDVVQHIIDEQAYTLQQMESYISDSR